MVKSRLKETITTRDGAFSHRGFIPDGIRAGGFVFFSALRGMSPADGKMSDDPKEQASQVFRNLDDLLEGAGITPEHVVKVTLYVQDLNQRGAFHEVWQEYFGESAPARIAVQVADVNASPGGNCLFALDVIALAE